MNYVLKNIFIIIKLGIRNEELRGKPIINVAGGKWQIASFETALQL